MSSFHAKVVAFAYAALVVGLTSHAGTILLSGDSTEAFYLTNTMPDLAIPGNGQFFLNVLGSGKQVVVRNTTFSGADAEIHEYYGSRPGVTSTFLTAPVTASQLATANLYAVTDPSVAFSAAETTAITGFLNGGGVLMLMGEASDISFGNATNAFINNLLTALGSSLSLNGQTLDIGDQTAAGGQIAVHPLTAGVSSFKFGATSAVVGGTPLFFTQNGTPFFVTDAVPEPTSALIALGLAAPAALLFRRAKVARGVL